MQSNLTAVATAFEHDDDVRIISHTVMPWIDTVGRLKEYADFKNIDSKKWQLVTGSEGVIYNLARKSYFAEEEIGYTKDSTQFLHTEHFLLVDGNRRLRDEVFQEKPRQRQNETVGHVRRTGRLRLVG